MAARLLVTLATAGALLGAPAGSAEAGPGLAGGASCSDVVLRPADLGPNYASVSSASDVRLDQSWCRETYARVGQLVGFVEPDGTRFVVSQVLVAGNPSAADREFQKVRQSILDEPGGSELSVPPLGEASAAALVRSQYPFGSAAQIVLFRTGRVLGEVAVYSYQVPDGLDDVLPLARTMAGRAG